MSDREIFEKYATTIDPLEEWRLGVPRILPSGIGREYTVALAVAAVCRWIAAEEKRREDEARDGPGVTQR